ncbi:c-type cytochrome biogenesis protein CcmI [Aurantimonas coralicida]|uniref:c-type cytochrome biogenesis protein CcmI n=1 Tax=Aurantimonas coralicida TaxID=182270 RepID=UPI001D18F2F0|nr:c-type cytochrome biogenesis protein CcmI [Aurantimonas coralicida]MCC4300110.1 c-type cytochrome biogenesis protein CcmI [Aurantimonas coralicida]
MLFWLLAAVLTTIAIFAALWPMCRSRAAPVATRAEHDLEVHRAQLRELEADLERGTIALGEAETARAEIARRLLKSQDQARGGEGRTAGRGRLALAASLAVALLLPLLSVGFYGVYGSPGEPDLPLAARLNSDPADADLAILVARAEARLRDEPDDARAGAVLAPIYLRMGRPQDAASAYLNTIRLDGETADRAAGLGEALTQMAGGEVTDKAEASFRRALALDPDYLPASFFLALNLSQEGRFAEAVPAWEALLERSGEGALWIETATAALNDARQRREMAGSGTGANAQAGPTADQVAAASGMGEHERRTMIEGMVSSLAERLKSAPNDPIGWERLIRSYTVLGETQKAQDAYAQATRLFAPDTPAGAEIATLRRALGLPGGDAAPSDTETP